MVLNFLVVEAPNVLLEVFLIQMHNIVDIVKNKPMVVMLVPLVVVLSHVLVVMILKSYPMENVFFKIKFRLQISLLVILVLYLMTTF